MAARQAGLSWARLRLMQAWIFATSGMNSLQSRKASGWQACCCCGVPCAAAGVGKPKASQRAASASADEETMMGRVFVIVGVPVDDKGDSRALRPRLILATRAVLCRPKRSKLIERHQ